jgi:drug/metabolite transporter (DMT)-like permease
VKASHFFPSKRLLGMAMVLLCGALWALSGVAMQYLLQHYGFHPGWLVTTRLISSGLILLAVHAILTRKSKDESIWTVWKDPSSRLPLIIFSIIGMLGVQYTFIMAIQESNTATATLLQYLGPVFITVYIALKARQLPNIIEIIALILAVLGTFFLITGGDLSSIQISTAATIWALTSAVFMAFYTIYPAKLTKRWGTILVNGWAMLLGGLTLGFINPPWHLQGEFTLESISLFLFTIIFGTAIPFSLYTKSILYIKPNETSILTSSEPLTATIVSVIWLHLPFGLFEWIGSLAIIGAAIILGSKPQPKPNNSS